MKAFLTISILGLLFVVIQGLSKAADDTARGQGDCQDCHSEMQQDSAEYIHPSVIACTGCHLPHDDEQASVLIGEPVALCYEPCHTGMGRSHPTGYQLINPTTNKPQDLTCTSACHDPHGSNFTGILQKTERETCFSCHDL